MIAWNDTRTHRETQRDRQRNIAYLKKGDMWMRIDQDEFLETLYRGYAEELAEYALALLHDESEARLAVQDAFHVACEKIGDLMDSPTPVGWLKLTVKNIARNMIKRKSRELKWIIPLSRLYAEPTAPESGEEALLERCRELVTPEEFELLRSIAVDGVTYQQKAAELGVSLWACYKRVERIRHRLWRGLQYEK